MDLYAYAGGDPVNYFDPDGRFASSVYQPVKATVLNTWNNPRFQGSLQAFGGLTEAVIGGGMALGSGGIAAPVGGLVMTHGLDHFFTGLQTAFSGSPRDSVTNQLLQKTGMSSQAASLVDGGLSIAGSMGGIAVIRARQLTAFPIYKLSPETALNLGEGLQETKNAIRLWPSPTKSNQLINGIEYVPHALERMSPRGLIHKGTEMVSRGVPPSVVENALKFGTKVPGNTSSEIVHIFENVRVVTNPEGTRVITVITTGR
jgi:hypothetical protein